jgi:hypothetical protein
MWYCELDFRVSDWKLYDHVSALVSCEVPGPKEELVCCTVWCNVDMFSCA